MYIIGRSIKLKKLIRGTRSNWCSRELVENLTLMFAARSAIWSSVTCKTENTLWTSIGSKDSALAQLIYRVIWNNNPLIALSTSIPLQVEIKENNSWWEQRGEEYSTSFCGGTGSPLRIAISCTHNANPTNPIRFYLCSLIITPPYW